MQVGLERSIAPLRNNDSVLDDHGGGGRRDLL
jgi:hypothetical protein